MKRRRALTLLLSLLLTPPAPAQPQDARLTTSRSIDHPWPFTPSFSSKEAWQERREQLRTQILVAQGLYPLPPKTPLNPVIHGKVDRDDYTIEKVFFASLPGHYVSGNLYRPRNRTGKSPGVLCPHGHWPGGRLQEISDAVAQKEIAAGAEQTLAGGKYILQARCAMLARMGCVVFHYDMVGYADAAKPIGHREGFTDVEAELRLQTFMGLQTWNGIRALDFLTSLPDVDPTRLACTGASGGGTQTMILGAIDDRLTVNVPAVMVSTAMQGGCICENSSLLRIATNNVEFAACFAPKPQAMTGANDWTKEIETKGLPELKQIYALYGAQELVYAKHFNFPHNYNQVSREMMYNWLNDHFKLGYQSPVKEKPFTPVPPKELSVYDAEHPLPADAADPKTLRKYMTETSDKQLGDLAKTSPDEYRRTLTSALRAMITDKLPAAGEVESRKLQAPGSVEIQLVSRKGAGEAIAAHLVKPKKWNGTVIIWVDGKLGAAAPYNGDGIPAAKAILDRGDAYLAADVYWTNSLAGPVPADPKSTTRPNAPGRYANYNYAGYTYGYNRSTLANRAHDLLTLVRYAHDLPGVKVVKLLATGSVAPAALVARALAGDAIAAAAIELKGFDFTEVEDLTDENMLSGALKYGGTPAFITLCPKTTTPLTHASPAQLAELMQ